MSGIGIWLVFLSAGLFYVIRHGSVARYSVALFAFILSEVSLALNFGESLYAYTWRNDVLTEGIVRSTSIQYCWFLSGMLAAMFFFYKSHLRAFRRCASLAGAPFVRSKADFWLIYVSGFAALLLFSLYVVKGGLSAVTGEDLTDKYQGGAYGYLVMATYGFAIAFVAAEFTGSIRIKLWARASALVLIIFSLLVLKARFLAASILFTGIYTGFIRKRITTASLDFRSVIFFILLIVFVLLYPFLRNYLVDGFYGTDSLTLHDFLLITIASSDIIHPFITTAELLSEIDVIQIYEISLVNYLKIISPASVFFNVGETEAQWFVRNFYPSLYERGYGTGFSAVAGSIVYGGLAYGPVAYGFLTGLVLEVLCIRALAARSLTISRILYLTGPLMFLFLERVGYMASLKTLVLILLLTMVIRLSTRIILGK